MFDDGSVWPVVVAVLLFELSEKIEFVDFHRRAFMNYKYSHPRKANVTQREREKKKQQQQHTACINLNQTIL